MRASSIIGIMVSLAGLCTLSCKSRDHSRSTVAEIGDEALPAAKTANDSYAVMIYGYEVPAQGAGATHTFGTFVRAAADGTIVEEVEISWLPATFSTSDTDLKKADGAPGSGRNFSVAESFSFGQALNAKTCEFGPFMITKELFEVARLKAKTLATGKIGYKMIDGGPLAVSKDRGLAARGEGGYSNCIHALADLPLKGPKVFTGAVSGCEASNTVAEYFFNAGFFDAEGQLADSGVNVESMKQTLATYFRDRAGGGAEESFPQGKVSGESPDTCVVLRDGLVSAQVDPEVADQSLKQTCQDFSACLKNVDPAFRIKESDLEDWMLKQMCPVKEQCWSGANNWWRWGAKQMDECRQYGPQKKGG